MPKQKSFLIIILVIAFAVTAPAAFAALTFDTTTITGSGALNLNPTGQPVTVNGDLTVTGTCTGCGGGGGTPGGSTTQIQYNNAGSFGGSAALTFANGLLNAGLSDVSNVQAVSTPSGGSTGYEYYIVATLGSLTTTAYGDDTGYVFFADGPAVLDATHYNTITWDAVPGADGYDIYTDERDGTPSTLGLLAHVGSGVLTFRDDGDVADGNIVYPSNTSGISTHALTVTHINGDDTSSILPYITHNSGHNDTGFWLGGGGPGKGTMNLTGEFNLGLGSGMGHITGSASNNIGIAFFGALGNLTTGDQNLGIGRNACGGLTTGNGNICLGFNTGLDMSATVSNTIQIGVWDATAGNTSNMTVIGNSSQTDFYAGSKSANANIHGKAMFLNVTTFASLGTCTEGAIKPVSDSNTNTWGATITGTGANHVLAYCDGTNWTVMAK